MSGLELAGVAASILQIAEIGGQLSIKLCTFCHKIKNADKNIQNLSNDVALTSNVLRQLGDSLERDKKGQLYSKQALSTAQDVLAECTKVFEQISAAIDTPDGSSARDRVARAAARFAFVLKESQLDVLKSNLERLKSTMLLMLNVIMYAGQVRNRLDTSILQEQQELIQTLMQERRATELRFQKHLKAIGSPNPFTDSLSNQRDPKFPGISLHAVDNSFSNVPSMGELNKYCLLITRILSDIDTFKSDLEFNRHQRMATDVWRMHDRELWHFVATHGREAGDWLRKQVSRPAIFEFQPRVRDIDFVSYSASMDTRVSPDALAQPKPVTAVMSHTYDSEMDNCSDRPQSQDINYRPIVDIPPFVQQPSPSNNDDAKRVTEEGTSLERSREDLPKHNPDIALGNEVLISYSDGNRPDIAISERLVQPADVSGQSTTLIPTRGTGSPPQMDLDKKDASAPRVLDCSLNYLSKQSSQPDHKDSSHANVHSQDRPHFCPVEGCARGVGGKGFKRKNEMLRHALVHNTPGYVCPLCPEQERKFRRPDNLELHVRVHHADKSKDDPALRAVLTQGSEWKRGRKRRQLWLSGSQISMVQSHENNDAKDEGQGDQVNPAGCQVPIAHASVDSPGKQLNALRSPKRRERSCHDPNSPSADLDPRAPPKLHMCKPKAPAPREDVYVPSPNELELRRQLKDENADIQNWLASVSAANCEAEDEAPAIQGREERRRAKSTGDPSHYQDHFNHKLRPNDSAIPGPGVLLCESSNGDFSEPEPSSESEGKSEIEGLILEWTTLGKDEIKY
ncbi:hypothetical protein PHISCL_08120 [Aspergillus sclerotialis]|uniref:C2H2-type domain-containing protein n=1 Tax=Aspergillus sclerotialis TaxID=2070753 RepID=A0A3A2Z8W9_9EURO|nr:hypothetical protein PHISCL_08120 [Aspergillus sclerotialis]